MRFHSYYKLIKIIYTFIHFSGRMCCQCYMCECSSVCFCCILQDADELFGGSRSRRRQTYPWLCGLLTQKIIRLSTRKKVVRE